MQRAFCSPRSTASPHSPPKTKAINAIKQECPARRALRQYPQAKTSKGLKTNKKRTPGFPSAFHPPILTTHCTPYPVLLRSPPHPDLPQLLRESVNNPGVGEKTPQTSGIGRITSIKR